MLKEFFNTDKISIPIGKFFSRFPLTPNQWSLLSVLPAIIGFYFALQKDPVLSFLFFTLAGACDAIDGGIARFKGVTTKFGAFLDGSMDRFVDFLLVFSFLFFELPSVWIWPMEYWLVATAFFCLMPTFEVAYANHRQAVPDPHEKIIWRILHRTEMYPLFLIALISIKFSKTLASWLIIFTTILSFVTSVQTIVLTYIKSKNYPQTLKVP
jgi:phosphatidylglycerophosphate synthase